MLCETNNISRLRRVHIHPFTDASQPLSTGRLLSVFVSPGTPLAVERVPQVGSRQLLGPRLQHRSSYDIDGSMELSVHELTACIASG
jgi:hypothetical protein